MLRTPLPCGSTYMQSAFKAQACKSHRLQPIILSCIVKGRQNALYTHITEKAAARYLRSIGGRGECLII